MSYTVISGEEDRVLATVADTIFDALALARKSARDNDKVTIAADDGWILTLDELEELAKN